MYIDNMDAQMSFISVDDAGRLLAHLGGDEIQGAVNGADRGTISPREILTYVYRRTGKRRLLMRPAIRRHIMGRPATASIQSAPGVRDLCFPI